LTTAPTIIPFGIVTAGSTDFSFNTATGEFAAPALGFYQFNYAVTLSNAGSTAVFASVNISVDGNFLSSSACTVPATGVQTLSGSSILQLLPEQQVGLTVTTIGGVTVQGPTTIGAPPYPTTFTGFSLF